jgi:hypothetical protein
MTVLLGSVFACPSKAAAIATETLPIGGSCPGTSQLCPPAEPVTYLTSKSRVLVSFSSGPLSCADLGLFFFIDGQPAGGTPFAPPQGAAATVLQWPTDGAAHLLSVEGISRDGGCNDGALLNWAGTLSLAYTPPPLPPPPSPCPDPPLGGFTLRASIGAPHSTHRTLMVNYGRRVTIRGTLWAPSPNSPVAGVGICLVRVDTTPSRNRQHVTLLRTDSRGRFAYHFRAAESSDIRLVYRDGVNGVEDSLGLRVRARVGLHVSRRAVRNGQWEKFTGRVSNRPLPRILVVDLQAEVGANSWQTFQQHFVSHTGRFAFAYQFRRTFTHQVYTFRAIVPTVPQYPFIAGESRPLRVAVDP